VKGIVLAGGAGTRLYPLTVGTSKQLLPIFDKPMIYYPLSVLMLAGCREILVITTPTDKERFCQLLGDGSRLGVSISYAVQEKPRGLADAFLVGRSFIGGSSVMLILGDNILYGHDLVDMLQAAVKKNKGATIFAYRVSDPSQYGVVEFDEQGRAVSLEEKPHNPKSNYAVVGLYIYDNSVVDFARGIRPSARGELEITDLNRIYLQNGSLSVEMMGRGFAWLDTGTHESMVDAANYIRTMQERQGLQIACLEEIALGMSYIGLEKFDMLAADAPRSSYGEYLRRLSNRGAENRNRNS
jgi:glucose-1-phosphate thymidylyltransferase